MSSSRNLTQERLKELLSYNQETGCFTWLSNGKDAGCKNGQGYIQISVGNKLYLAHRLAWLYIYGEWPVNFLDHINGIRNDNRFCNLRKATNAENIQNQRIPTVRSVTGFLGVSRSGKNKFRANIGYEGKVKHLGTFDTAEAAHAEYVSAKRELHKGCTI